MNSYLENVYMYTQVGGISQSWHNCTQFVWRMQVGYLHGWHHWTRETANRVCDKLPIVAATCIAHGCSNFGFEKPQKKMKIELADKARKRDCQ